jgi:transcription elongation factor Elf1
MLEEFACPNCGSASVVYIDAEGDDGHMVCRHCGTFLMTRGQFRRLVEASSALLDVHTSRC